MAWLTSARASRIAQPLALAGTQASAVKRLSATSAATVTRPGQAITAAALRRARRRLTTIR